MLFKAVMKYRAFRHPNQALLLTRGLATQAKATSPLYPFDSFDVRGKVIAVTGGARGLGLQMSAQLAAAGGQVYAIDRLDHPDIEFLEEQKRESPLGGSLHYEKVDVTCVKDVDKTATLIADRHSRIDGLIAAAGIPHVQSAIEHPQVTVEDIMRTNFFGAFTCATAFGRQMLERKCRGSLVLVASMSGLVANKGMYSSAYNSSKAAVVQLARNLAQEWGPVDREGRGGIRVNALCPGHIYTPMVEKTLHDEPAAREIWEKENMLQRIARPWEFRGAALFLLSDASSYMTGNKLVIDGGHTAW